MAVFTKNNYDLAKLIEWSDIIEVIENEYDNGSYRSHGDDDCPNTIVCQNEMLTERILDVVDEVRKEWATKQCHVFTSFAKGAHTFGRHNDLEDVLLIGAIGRTSYKFDNGKEHLIEPGDSLFIHKGEYHDPIVHSARATLSISILEENKWKGSFETTNRDTSQLTFI